MLITETTILTSVTADTDAILLEIASRTAVMLVLGATTVLTQATLTSEVHPNGAARCTVLGLDPERASVAVTVTTLSHEPAGSGRKSVLMSAMIVVTTETIHGSQRLTDALLVSIPNRIAKPTVVIRSRRNEQPQGHVDGSGWGEFRDGNQARL